MKKINLLRIKIIALLLLLALSASCQNFECEKYGENGVLILKIKRSGLPNWSDNKSFSGHVSGVGI